MYKIIWIAEGESWAVEERDNDNNLILFKDEDEARDRVIELNKECDGDMAHFKMSASDAEVAEWEARQPQKPSYVIMAVGMGNVYVPSMPKTRSARSYDNLEEALREAHRLTHKHNRQVFWVEDLNDPNRPSDGIRK